MIQDQIICSRYEAVVFYTPEKGRRKKKREMLGEGKYYFGGGEKQGRKYFEYFTYLTYLAYFAYSHTSNLSFFYTGKIFGEQILP